MKSILCLFVLKIGLFFHGSSAFSSAAFVAGRSCNYDAPSQKLYSSSQTNNGVDKPPSASGNLLWLQERFKFTEEWRRHKEASATTVWIDGMDRTVVLARVDWLKERLDLSNDELKTIVQRGFHFVHFRPDNLDTKLRWLEDRLDLDGDQLRKMITRTPKLLQSSVNNTFEPKLSWLQKRLSIDDRTVRKIVVRQPAILFYSTSKNLEPTLQWLEEKFIWRILAMLAR